MSDYKTLEEISQIYHELKEKWAIDIKNFIKNKATDEQLLIITKWIVNVIDEYREDVIIKNVRDVRKDYDKLIKK